MARVLQSFEGIVRRAAKYEVVIASHLFETRNIHQLMPQIVRQLFDDGHYSQATFEAFKFIDRQVATLAAQPTTGQKLMLHVFDKERPILKLTPCDSMSEKDEQEGYRFLFAGSMLAIRNPRGHEHSVYDTPDECLDHLVLASALLRKLESAGFLIRP